MIDLLIAALDIAALAFILLAGFMPLSDKSLREDKDEPFIAIEIPDWVPGSLLVLNAFALLIQ